MYSKKDNVHTYTEVKHIAILVLITQLSQMALSQFQFFVTPLV
jgi:hypothetical protein